MVYMWGSGSCGIVPLGIHLTIPLPPMVVLRLLITFDIVRIAEILSRHIMEYEVALFLVVPYGAIQFVRDKCQIPRFGVTTLCFLTITCSFRDVYGVMPEDTRIRMSNVILLHAISFVLFCDVGPFPAVFCAMWRSLIKFLSGVDVVELLKDPADCPEEKAQCCVCLDEDPVYAGAQCKHGPVLCFGCCSLLVDERLKASAKNKSAVRPLATLADVAVPCPICRLVSPVNMVGIENRQTTNEACHRSCTGVDSRWRAFAKYLMCLLVMLLMQWSLNTSFIDVWFLISFCVTLPSLLFQCIVFAAGLLGRCWHNTLVGAVILFRRLWKDNFL